MEYSKKILPFLKAEYFRNPNEQRVFTATYDFIIKYNKLPTLESLIIDFDQAAGVPNADRDECKKLITQIISQELEADQQWLIDNTEKFCQDRAIYNAMVKALMIAEGQDKTHTTGAIPGILQDALGVSFDPHVGHDYLEDWEERYDFYHSVEEKIPFDLDMFNKITRDGVARKSLNIILGGVNVGKTLALCHLASSYLTQGKNVLYISLEMAEERISERIDANLMNIRLDELETLPKDLYERKVKLLKSKTLGKLIIKEYPSSSASAANFRALLNELNLKKNFVPDVILIDYINEATSSRIKIGGTVNSYFFIKAIAQEFRGIAQEYNLPLWTATQLTRGGFKSSDVDLDDTAESFGLPAVADFMVAITTDDDLEKLGQYAVKQLKNRYNKKTSNKRFTIGVDYDKMRLYNTEDTSQTLVDSGTETEKPKGLSKFQGIKVTDDDD